MGLRSRSSSSIPRTSRRLRVTTSFLAHIGQHHHPHIVIRSSSGDRALEILILEILIRDNRIIPHTRRDLVRALDQQQLEAFDQGGTDPELVHRLASVLDAVNLFVLTIGTPVELEDATAISLRSDFFLPGEVVQGSPLEASLEIRCETSDFLGFARTAEIFSGRSSLPRSLCCSGDGLGDAGPVEHRPAAED